MLDTPFQSPADVALMAAPTAPRLPKGAMNPTQARRVAEDFEAMFLSQMLKPLFEGIEVEEPFGGGSAEETWCSLQIDEYGKAITKAGGIGIADTVFRQLMQMQEAAQP